MRQEAIQEVLQLKQQVILLMHVHFWGGLYMTLVLILLATIDGSSPRCEG